MGRRNRRLRDTALREMEALYQADPCAYEAVLAVVRVLADIADRGRR